MRAGQEILREGNTEHLRRFGFNERTNSHIPSYRFYRRPQVLETTVFSIPVEDIRKFASGVLSELQRGSRLNPFSRQAPDRE